LQGTIGNNTPYGGWVQSSVFQVAAHRGRWTTDLQAMEQEKEFIVRLFENAVAKAM